jgi:hypothetical protein
MATTAAITTNTSATSMLADLARAIKAAAETIEMIASLWFLALTRYSTKKITRPKTAMNAIRFAFPTKP